MKGTIWILTKTGTPWPVSRKIIPMVKETKNKNQPRKSRKIHTNNLLAMLALPHSSKPVAQPR